MVKMTFLRLSAAVLAALSACVQPVSAQPEVGEVVSQQLPVLKGSEFDADVTLAWEQGTYPPRGADTVYCRTLVGGMVTSQSNFEAFDPDVGGLAATGTCTAITVDKVGMETVTIELSFDKDFAETTTGDLRVRVIPGGITVLPPIITVFLAITTQDVLVSLFCGVWSAAFFIHSFDPLRGFLRTLDTYIIGSLYDEGHIKIILFNWFLCGVTALIQRGGGGQGLANIIVKKAKTRKLTMLVCVLCGAAIFFDDYASSLIVGNTFRPIMDMMMISREKLAYIVDSTSAPVASVSPISSWVGYEMSLIQDSYTAIEENGVNLASQYGWTTSPFIVFCKTIPGRFYPIGMLFLQVLLILTQRDFGPMFKAERRSHREGKLYADNADKEAVRINPELELKSNVPPRWWNAAIPVVLIVVLVFVGLIATGVDAVEADPDLSMNIQNVFGEGDSYNALLWSTFLVSILTWVLFRVQYVTKDGHITTIFMKKKHKGSHAIMKIKESEGAWIEGIKQLVSTTLVLILAWSIGNIMTVLGTDDFIASAVSAAIDPRAISTLVFILGALISLATGTSWGTMAILFPVATKAAFQADPGNEDIMLSTIASILSGSVFGDHISPISDTTILSAIACRCDLMAHVKTQAPYAILVGVIAMFCGDLLSGYLYPMWAGLLVTIVVICVVAFFISAKPDSESDKVDIVNKAFGACGCCGLRAFFATRKANKQAKRDAEASSDDDSMSEFKKGGKEKEAGELEQGSSSSGGPDNLTMQSASTLRDGMSSVEPSAHGGGAYDGNAHSNVPTDEPMTAPPGNAAPFRQGTL